MGVRVFSKSLAGNETWRIKAAGDHVRCTEGDKSFTLRLEKPSTGHGERGSHNFEALVITNGATAQTVTLYIGYEDFQQGGYEEFEFQRGFGVDPDGRVDDARLALDGGASLTTVPQSPDTFDSATGVTVGAAATEIYAADADMVEVMVKADKSNSEAVYVIDSAGAVGDGIPLEPGEGQVITTSGAVHAICTSGGQKLYRARTTRS